MFNNMATVVREAIEEMNRSGALEYKIQDSGVVVAVAGSEAAKRLASAKGNVLQTIKIGEKQYSVFFGMVHENQ